MDGILNMAKGAIGGFIPGLFLFVHLYAFFVILAHRAEGQAAIENWSLPLNDVVTTSIIIVVFGYLLGVLLRVFQCEAVDRLSAIYLLLGTRSKRCISRSCMYFWMCIRALVSPRLWRTAYGPNGWRAGRFSIFRPGLSKYFPLKKDPVYLTDRFPYFGYLEDLCKKRLPSTTLDFFNDTWKGQRRKGRRDNRQFLNFCKGILHSIDERATQEIQGAEHLCRYIAQMFYALMISIAIIMMSIMLIYSEHGPATRLLGVLTLLVVSYLACLAVILSQYRWMRIKESETVFTACFANKKRIRSLLESSGS